MPSSTVLDDYLSPLLAGNRTACRDIVRRQAIQTSDPFRLYTELLWPAMERVEKLYRGDRINAAAEHMATRINRSIADQLQLHLPRSQPNGKRLLIACADGEPEELGAQMCADLFEARGWETYFLGGGVPNDEILSLVGQLRPDILLIFGTQPSGVPGVRRLIDLIRGVGAHPTLNIMVSGGVFNRAEGLWKEVGADLLAKTAHDAIPLAEKAEPHMHIPRPLGAAKKRRRRRRPASPAAATA
ncbi:MAG: cobalamin B12-binding domain-containing protein [Planctomycetes bacterium]|nr:cobalamin B12-binding domain-containing protein [Planctomycetota bacterium]